MRLPAPLKHLCVIACISFVIPLQAQTFDDIIAANPRIDCWDVTYNAVPVIGRLYSQGKIDSIYLFLDYWVGKCRPMEPTFRLRNILDIQTGQFHADSIGQGWLELLIAYRRSLVTPYEYYYPVDNEFVLQKRAYDSLTQKMASETLALSTDERLMLDFYSSPSPTFENIRSTTKPSRLKSLYDEMYTQALRQPVAHLSFITGAVQHYHNLSSFGTRPHFGAAMGVKWMRQNLDLILDFRAGPAKEPYSFLYQDSLITHDKWTGLYVGIEYTFDFLQTDRWTVGISPGVGYDRITTLTMDNDYGEDPAFLPSLNKNAGLVLKYRLGKSGGYMGLHLRYNWVDYDNPGGTPLYGEYFNVRLTIGSFTDYWRNARLKSLE